MSGEAAGGRTIFRVAALALAIGGGAFLVWRGQSAPSPPEPAPEPAVTAPAPRVATPPTPADGAPPAPRADGGADGAAARGPAGGGADGGADAAPVERLPGHLLDSSKSGGAGLVIPGLE